MGSSPQEASDRLIRSMTVAVVGLNAGLPLLTLSSIALGSGGSGSGPGYLATAVAATAGYLCLQMPLVLAATRGVRLPAQGWRLAGAAAVVAVGLPVIGPGWLGAVDSLGALFLVVLRPPWSFALFAAVTAVSAPMELAAGPPWFLGSIMAGVCLAVIAWPIPALRQLQAARMRLAEEAVVRERVRIDQELRLTVGRDLEAIAAAGDRAAALAGQDVAAAATELTAMVERSRGALLRARRMLSRYQRVSLRGEVETAAGIDVEVVLPADEVVDRELAAGPEVPGRAELRRRLPDLLENPTVGSCCLAVVDGVDGWRVELRTSPTPAPSRPDRAGRMTGRVGP